jgi:SAM-dependent methyltransferase
MPLDTPLHIPAPAGVSEEDTWAWYRNIPLELRSGYLPGDHAGRLTAYYRDAGLLRGWRRPFFRHHYSRPFARAAAFLLEPVRTGVLLDLGCGFGTQSLYLAMRGARILALDSDPLALDVLARRKAFYESQTGTRLDIRIACADVFQFDFASRGPIAGVHSLFAFNMMQPSSALLDRIVPHLVSGARWAVQDGNNRSWRARLFPSFRRAAWSPGEFDTHLRARGFAVVSHAGGAALPPLLWRCLPSSPCAILDGVLSKTWSFPVSHQILAEWTSTVRL